MFVERKTRFYCMLPQSSIERPRSCEIAYSCPVLVHLCGHDVDPAMVVLSCACELADALVLLSAVGQRIRNQARLFEGCDLHQENSNIHGRAVETR